MRVPETFLFLCRTLNSDMTPQSSHTIFNQDGSITVTSDNCVKKTSFNQDGSITDTLDITMADGKKQKITRNTGFNSDGSIDVSVHTEESKS